MRYSIKELSKILNAKNVKIIEDKIISGVQIDSRKINDGDLFIPFIGENLDGHSFINKARENKAAASLSLKDDIDEDINTIYVTDSLLSIQTLARDYLTKLDAKVIAITGSNGKTSTKDIIAEILSTKYKVHKTDGNFNNELGMPLTILAAPEDTEVLVLEMGADGFNQLNLLSDIAKPDFAVITNIGESHIEFFGDRSGIAKGKFEIISGLREDGIFIYSGDEVLLKNLVEKSSIKSIKCGFENENDILVESYKQEYDHISFKLNIFEDIAVSKLKGKHNILNIMYASAIAKNLGLTEDEIISSLKNLDKITKMRLESISYGENSLIINDAYNASPTSMKAAIDVLEDLENFSYKTIILGDMYELGPSEADFHKEVAYYLNKNINTSINRLISIGNLAKHITEATTNTKIEKLHFNNKEEISKYLLEHKINEEVILFKASRGMKLETIIEDLI
ncbi:MULTISPECIES: UDP-N-acetylmuramoyl-tripeptide--D-alanyl-D-alanine ligase [unclassified Gemella]|uniref:UDP-N-acetylmuramoyl-tripeptide--D-alanyl-D- alanine ligase n=1 Tax=unclassified Gemella TaxID=2624949 RepID=UPI0015D0774C|nr:MULTISPECIES: UDP-N-acetylmuramoyl-tripeptide--D-alanyl-D-alanine ligase [unclassified Gemella]MBF0710187.1 UDP-N-acetylmuramoyl-tripeptide--D-alanyl-D-alanine ligase [Gemella sp. GL1.1]NYS27531.1 UDP-N-acetylmuramoyl-tripeptide--D-alanyl-D-alanine ligase [Gemella sp. GL1]